MRGCASSGTGSDQLIDGVLANVLGGADALIPEELVVGIREAANHFVVGPGNEDLVLRREVHYALSDVDSITDGVEVAVNVPDQFDGTQIDANANEQAGLLLDYVMKEGGAELERGEHGGLGVAKE